MQSDKTKIKKIIRTILNESKTGAGAEAIIFKIIDVANKKDAIIKDAGYENAYDFITVNTGNGRFYKTTAHDYLSKKNKEFVYLSEEWSKLIGELYSFYKTKLADTLKNQGESEMRKLFDEIQVFLRQDEYEQYTGVVAFDLASFAKNLLSNK